MSKYQRDIASASVISSWQRYVAAEPAFLSVLFQSQGGDPLDHALPAVAHALEGGFVPRQHKARVDQAKAGSSLHRGKGEGHHGVERRPIADVACVPAGDRLKVITIDSTSDPAMHGAAVGNQYKVS